jgi:hypothetical protein
MQAADGAFLGDEGYHRSAMRNRFGRLAKGAVASTAAALCLLLGPTPGSAARGSGILGTHLVAGSGNVPIRPGWKVATAFFTIDFTRGPGHKIEFVDIGHRLDFHALQFTSATWTKHSVRFVGTGISDGKRVPFVAAAIDGATADFFYIAWDHSARRGGQLANGAVTITF